MRILILGFTKLKFMPYLHFYLDQIDCNTNDVHIVYWNRDLQDEDLIRYRNTTLHGFEAFMEDYIPKIAKIKHFWNYRRFVKGIINTHKFDYIISLHTLPGLCIIDTLLLRYKGRYILDYRDSTFEQNILFGYIVKRMAVNARVVFVSSDAFRKYLPTNGVEIITSHNILSESISHRHVRKESYETSDRIRVSFWGLLRHYKHNLLIVNHLANDPRFELHYYGRSQKMGETMQQYLHDNNIHNVFLHGEYEPEERYAFASKTDMLLNSYEDSNTLLAMGNKYYDGIIFYIPQICMKGSYMGQRCVERGTGCELNPSEDNYADKLFKYYESLNMEHFYSNCDKDLESILAEYNYGKSIVHQLLND